MRKNYKHCYSNKYGEYSTLSLAQSACDSDSNCRGVYDESCDNSGSFYLCLISAGLEASTGGSCVYEKTAGSWHFDSCGSGVKIIYYIIIFCLYVIFRL